jgi:hypothetical protein
MNRATAVIVAAGVAGVSACSNAKPAGPAGAGQQPSESAVLKPASAPLAAGGGAPAIGSTCLPSDGWQPAALAVPKTTNSNPKIGDPVEAVMVPAGYIDYPQLAPGTKYCEPPQANAPGYMTANCRTDADCADNAKCDDVHCRAACASDSDCTTPRYCGAPVGTGGVRFCQRRPNPPSWAF